MRAIRDIQGFTRRGAVRAQAAWRDERGSAMTEYGLLLIFVVFAAFAIIMLFGNQVLQMFTDAQTEFSDARNPNPEP